MKRMVHLCSPIYQPRKYAVTHSENVTTEITFSGGFNDVSQTAMNSCANGTLNVFDMSPWRDDEIIGWRPVCGAPDKMGARKRRYSDGISCKRCPRTHAWRKHHKRSTDAA